MSHVALQLPGGLAETVGQLVVLAGTLVLVLILVAFGAFAYRNLRGDGVDWPDDEDGTPGSDGDDLQRGDNDDEWEYY